MKKLQYNSPVILTFFLLSLGVTRMACAMVASQGLSTTFLINSSSSKDIPIFSPLIRAFRVKQFKRNL